MSDRMSPLSVKCPLCLARPGVKCLKRRKMKPGEVVHFKRKLAWKKSLSAVRRLADHRLNGEPHE
jgi:hypothetical protein